MHAPGVDGSRKANILLVDDQSENLLALEAVLAPLGQRLVSATSGREALKHLLTEEFALVLLDVQMPDLDGFETATDIKRREKTRDLPIIFLTAIDKERRHVFRGYTAGAVDYVFKPVDPEILRSKVKVFVDLHLKGMALHESEERFRKAFEDAPIGIGLVSPDGRWLRVNRSLCDITGYPDGELLDKPFDELIHAEDRRGDSRPLDEAMAGHSGSQRLEKRYMHAGGHFIWVVVSASSVRNAGGQPLYLIVQMEDVTERKQAEGELIRQALHDSLTGLANRTLFLDRLELALRRLERRASSVAVLFLDLDRFKVANDSLGHYCGDELLVAVGERLCDLLRPSDTVARLGGDEFALLCEETNERDAVTVAERILEAIAQPFEIGGSEVFVTTSIGIVIANHSGGDPADLIRDADAAMYRAKENGKARYELFDHEMRARAMERLAMENALHRALERIEFRVFYQPEVDLETGAVRGVEALLRWQHPQRGLVSPCDFVPLAEETGLIVPVGAWVLEEACRQAQSWRERYPHQASLGVAVNLSGRQFAQPDLLELVEKVLASTGLDASALCLEMTETVLIENSEQTLSVLAGLRRLGVRTGIDDFGTGYSSLSYLKSFDVDVLKVDRSFVNGLTPGGHDSAILAAVARLADALDLTVVAEGVETREQLAELRNLGFKSAQGYHFARPGPADAIGELLQRLGGDPRARLARTSE